MEHQLLKLRSDNIFTKNTKPLHWIDLQVRILTTEVNEDCALHFGERYFGTDNWKMRVQTHKPTTRCTLYNNYLTWAKFFYFYFLIGFYTYEVQLYTIPGDISPT